MSKLFEELKRRNVFRVAAAYGVVGWLLIQVIDTVSPRLGLPDWVPTLVIVMVLLGFPIALLLAWAFEITTEGLKKTADVAEGESIVHTTGRKLNVVIIATLVFALGYFIWESRFAGDVQTPEIESATVITDKSIAVLPFADFSAGGDQIWFADGLSEEILNSLVRIPDLKVASRTSSFAHRNSSLEVTEIARAIGVAHILEGSVRRSDTRLRITAQLIRAADGFHMWSENYDRTPDDAITIQEELAVSISQALQTAMDPAALAAMADVGTESIAAYNAYLEGLSLKPCIDDLSCVAAYERAIGFDPEFAEAEFQLATLWDRQLDLAQLNADPGITYVQIMERFHRHIARAIEFARSPADLLKYRALRARVDLRLAERRELLLAYLELRPNDAQSWIALAVAQQDMGDLPGTLVALKAAEQLNIDIEDTIGLIIQYRESGDLLSAAGLARRVMVEAPGNRSAQYQAQRALLWVGAVSEAAQAARLYHQSSFADGTLTILERDRAETVNIRQACAEGRVADANRHFENLGAIDESDGIVLHWQALLTLGRDQEAEDLLRIYDAPETVLQLLSFFEYPEFDPRPFPSLMVVLEREGVALKPLIPIPYACTD